MPTRIELISLLDTSHLPGQPTIDLAAFPNTAGWYWTWSRTPDGLFWWYVDFEDGNVESAGASANAYARCVR